MIQAKYYFPTEISFGPDSVKKLGEEARSLGVQRPLVVTDRDVAKLPFMQKILDQLKSSYLAVEVFSEIWGNPVKAQVAKGKEKYQSHSADSIIAIGGGAALDVSKAIALWIHHPGDLFDYEDAPGAKSIDGKVPPILAVPTTAGTGSEVGRAAVVSDDRTKVKKILFSPKLLPRKVFLDPMLTLGLPPSVTAATGMDALTHLIEAYLAKGFHPLADGIALEGIRLVSDSLVKAVKFAKAKEKATEAHLAARGDMLNASMMGAVAFQKGLGATHSCAHALSTVCDLHHGLANGILLPTLLHFNKKGERARFVRMAVAAGIKSPTPDAFIKWVEKLQTQVGIPKNLSSVGVTKEHIPRLVSAAYADGCHSLNPRSVTKKDFEGLFKKAMGK